MPSFYLLDSAQLPVKTEKRMPQNRISKVECYHLRYFGLIDVDMPEGAEKLDPSKVHSLASARETNSDFDQVMQKAEQFVSKTPEMK